MVDTHRPTDRHQEWPAGPEAGQMSRRRALQAYVPPAIVAMGLVKNPSLGPSGAGGPKPKDPKPKDPKPKDPKSKKGKS